MIRRWFIKHTEKKAVSGCGQADEAKIYSGPVPRYAPPGTFGCDQGKVPSFPVHRANEFRWRPAAATLKQWKDYS